MLVKTDRLAPQIRRMLPALLSGDQPELLLQRGEIPVVVNGTNVLARDYEDGDAANPERFARRRESGHVSSVRAGHRPLQGSPFGAHDGRGQFEVNVREGAVGSGEELPGPGWTL